MNLVTRILVLSDFFLFFSVGLLSPIYAVFVLDNVQGSSLQIIGFATAIFWLVRVASVIPLSRIMDKLKGRGMNIILCFWHPTDFHYAARFDCRVTALAYLRYSSAEWHCLFDDYSGLARHLHQKS